MGYILSKIFMQTVHIHPKALIGGDIADHSFAQAGDAQGFLHAVVYLTGEVNHRFFHLCRFDPHEVTGSGNSDEVGDGATGSEVAKRTLWITHQFAHPTDQFVLDAHGAGVGKE